MKTTVSILAPVEHEILDWAINSEFFGETESDLPTGWSSWDRAGVLNSAQLVLDWEMPHIAMYAAFILLRLQDLYSDERDRYAKAARELEKRIRRALDSEGISEHETSFQDRRPIESNAR